MFFIFNWCATCQSCFIRPLHFLFNCSATKGPKGITQWPIDWCTYSMMKHKIAPTVDENKWLKRLNSQHNESTNQNSLSPQSLLSKQIREHHFEILGTSVINRLMSPPSLRITKYCCQEEVSSISFIKKHWLKSIIFKDNLLCICQEKLCP